MSKLLGVLYSYGFIAHHTIQLPINAYSGAEISDDRLDRAIKMGGQTESVPNWTRPPDLCLYVEAGYSFFM